MLSVFLQRPPPHTCSQASLFSTVSLAFIIVNGKVAPPSDEDMSELELYQLAIAVFMYLSLMLSTRRIHRDIGQTMAWLVLEG